MLQPANDNELGVDLLESPTDQDLGMAGLARYFRIVLMLAEVCDRMEDGLLDNLAYLRDRDPDDPQALRLAYAYAANRHDPAIQQLISKSRLGVARIGLSPEIERPARVFEVKPAP